jgi:uncharacterized protein (DUF305 family)
MSKNLILITAILFVAVFTACRQPNPTPINSTQHVHADKTPGGVYSTNANGSIHSQPHQTSHREPMTRDASSHSTMKTAPDAAAQPYDLQFLDTMIVHHEGAIEMAKAAQAKAQSGELKALAAKMVADQQREINEMKRWREQWFAGKPSALNMEMAGMADSMKGMNMTRLNTATGKDFDIEFVNMMTPHHQGAVVMAREALTRSEHAEIKTLANQIIQAQEAETQQMQNWKTQWSK